MNKQLCSLQWPFPHADIHYHHVFHCRNGKYHGISCVCRYADGRYPAGGHDDLRRLLAAFQNITEGIALLLYVRAAGVSKAANRSGHYPFGFRQNIVCTGACRYGCRTGRTDHLCHGKLHRWQCDPFGALRFVFRSLCTVHRHRRRHSYGLHFGVSRKRNRHTDCHYGLYVYRNPDRAWQSRKPAYTACQ